jgi:phosphoenolpyruvate-protein phosphotransferase/dihydroxyacetone kinase phosphotransfer subunit
MIGIVIVSHSRALAEGLVGLIKQVALNDVPMAVAAGVGQNRQEFGTDAVEIMEAIQSVYSPDGVLVLMDLGSAILSAETALDLLPEEMHEHIRFCPAPLVEGAIAAGVQAGLGSSLQTVCEEAQQALIPKAQQLGENLPQVSIQATAPGAQTAAPGTSALEEILTLRNIHGLHARPAARFVKAAASFDADIQVTDLTSGKGPVTAKSLNRLATLGAVGGDQIKLSITGPEGQAALQALRDLVESGFGEAGMEAAPADAELQAAPETEPPPESALHAVPVSEGIALGPFYQYQPPPPPIPEYRPEDPQPEWERLQRALNNTAVSIQQRRQKLGERLSQMETAIFDAHLLILQDPDLLEKVHELIFKQQMNAAAAWHASINETADSYRTLADPYLQQRAADVIDVGNQMLFALAEKTGIEPIVFDQPVVLFAEEITPTETSQLDMSKVLGLVTVSGGPTSHSAILARALGIPAVTGIDVSVERVSDGTPVALDGFKGNFWIEPDPEVQKELQNRRNAWLAQRQKLLENSQRPAAMRDGTRVEVAANVGNAQDARSAIENGAEGIGLLRTEFLYLTRDTPPSEEEQWQTLNDIGEIMGDKPVIVRTLDVGGDKELPYIDLAPEANPFLGVRAIRLSLRRPDLFLPQLRAILRAGERHHLRVMFPMIANLDEVLQARRLMEQAHQDLVANGQAHCWPIETGIMVEIPAAAVLSPLIAREVDFFSIGTNDLTQYTLAAERGNPELAGFADALHPSVLQLIKQVAEASHCFGKWTGICGELAGDPLAIPILVGLGVDELSMNPASIPRAKALLRKIDRGMIGSLVENALRCNSASEVRQAATAFVEALPAEA